MTIQECAEDFLESFEGRTLRWARPSGSPTALETVRVMFGEGQHSLEVAVAYAAGSGGRPKADELRTLWKKRQANRPSPVLLVVLYIGVDGTPLAALVGTSGDPAPVVDLAVDRVARIALAALAESDRHSAARTIERLLAGLKDQLVPGLVNSGLFASHELRTGVPARNDWNTARAAARASLGLQGMALVRALGFEAVPRGSAAQLLTHHGQSRAIAVLLHEGEVFERPTGRFDALSPVAHGLALATKEALPWVIVLRGMQIRLYPARPDVGVGRKGQAETYTELDLALLSDEEAAYLILLFGPEALAPGGSVEQILAASQNFAADLGKRLRERIYEDVVPGLALAVATRAQPHTDEELAEVYHQTLIILFRLLFLAYAEDRGLLPYGRNPRYDRHAVKTLAKDFASEPGQTFDEGQTALWDDLTTVWHAVDEGNRNWDVPAYNGGLFSRDAATNPSGATISQMRLTDAEFGPVLEALLVDEGDEGTRGPVDFRSLTVREFGTIYEGLLESQLSIAPTDLKLDSKGHYLPVQSGEPIKVPQGQVYFHNKSGSRKNTGSYFTKSFAVERILDTALEPALDAHLQRVRELIEADDDAAAAQMFFDFRVADLAMGSGHFLVAAIDRIEAKFTTFLAERPIPEVTDELTRLSQLAYEALGDQAEHAEIDPGALLRRQIARRCLYGLDLNIMAVELARLGVWIHTFVPGLPMSALDHGLIVGNSLVGIGTVEEVLSVLDPDTGGGTVSLFEEQITDALSTARDRLLRVARTAEATKQEVREARAAHSQAMEDAQDARALFDAAVAIRLGFISRPATPEDAIHAANTEAVRARMAESGVKHFPVQFPEVFLRERPGFDVLLGNPPWDKLQVEEHSFYALHFPGLRSLSQAEAEQEIARIRKERPDLADEYEHQTNVTQTVKTALAAGPYPGLNAGRPDLYKAFAWRMWDLVRRDGHIGVVLPRKALEASGMKDWRQAVLKEATFTDVTTLTNSRNWVFDDVTVRYTVGLIGLRADRTVIKGRRLPLRGPFHDLSSFHAGIKVHTDGLSVDDLLDWSDSAAFPLLPDAEALRVFLTIRSHPRLDQDAPGWSVRGLRELNATDDKKHFLFDRRDGLWPVYKGESFERWNPETDTMYAWAEPAHIKGVLQARRANQIRMKRSAFYRMPREWAADVNTLPCMAPRIAWRDVARATDSRTLVAALVPPETILVHLAYYLFWREGGPRQQAYALGVLSAMPFDWFARQMVEQHVTIEFMRAAPIPPFQDGAPLCDRVVHIAGRLAAVDERYAGWAVEAGVPVGSITDGSERDDLVAELDAVTAHLYGLRKNDLEQIFRTFHRGWNYQERLSAALTHFDRWAGSLSEGDQA
ncbi:Eco57I restriction-modification methylase domain-containing protein [Streptomyces antibioticus]|uniref:Eco57I restriction-modification methylase domain-containing protein n=1 Tax=Streptomyces antibioticus TaxID=1890 RepID=UPI0033D34336